MREYSTDLHAYCTDLDEYCTEDCDTSFFGMDHPLEYQQNDEFRNSGIDITE